MVFSQEDALLIKNMYLSKGYGPVRLLNEFPEKGRKLDSVKTLLKKVCLTGTTERQIHNVDELKRRLVDVRSGLQQSVVDAAVSEWRKRLQACVRAKGGHFEHLL